MLTMEKYIATRPYRIRHLMPRWIGHLQVTLGSRGWFVAISVLLSQPWFSCCKYKGLSEKIGWSVWICLTFSTEGAFQNGRQNDYFWQYLSLWSSERPNFGVYTYVFITKESNKVICLVTDTFLGEQPSLFQYGRQNMYIYIYKLFI